MYKDIAKNRDVQKKFITLNKIKASLVLGMNFPFVNIDTVLTAPLFNRKFSNRMMIVNHEMLKVPFSTVVKDKKWQKTLYRIRYFLFLWQALNVIWQTIFFLSKATNHGCKSNEVINCHQTSITISPVHLWWCSNETDMQKLI